MDTDKVPHDAYHHSGPLCGEPRCMARASWKELSNLPCARWMLVGTYVGFATVGAFVAWYMHDSFLGLDLSQDGHSTVTWYQLTHWNQCSTWRNFHVRSACVLSPPPTVVGVRVKTS